MTKWKNSYIDKTILIKLNIYRLTWELKTSEYKFTETLKSFIQNYHNAQTIQNHLGPNSTFLFNSFLVICLVWASFWQIHRVCGTFDWTDCPRIARNSKPRWIHFLGYISWANIEALVTLVELKHLPRWSEPSIYNSLDWLEWAKCISSARIGEDIRQSAHTDFTHLGSHSTIFYCNTTPATQTANKTQTSTNFNKLYT